MSPLTAVTRLTISAREHFSSLLVRGTVSLQLVEEPASPELIVENAGASQAHFERQAPTPDLKLLTHTQERRQPCDLARDVLASIWFSLCQYHRPTRPQKLGSKKMGGGQK